MTYKMNYTQFRMLGADKSKVIEYINETFCLASEVTDLIIEVRPEDEALKNRLERGGNYENK